MRSLGWSSSGRCHIVDMVGAESRHRTTGDVAPVHKSTITLEIGVIIHCITGSHSLQEMRSVMKMRIAVLGVISNPITSVNAMKVIQQINCIFCHIRQAITTLPSSSSTSRYLVAMRCNTSKSTNSSTSLDSTIESYDRCQIV